MNLSFKIKIPSAYKDSDIFGNLVIVIFVLAFMLQYTTAIDPEVSNYIYMVLGGVSIAYYWIKGSERIALTRAIAFIFVYMLLFMISWIVNGNADIIEVLWPIGFMGIGFSLIAGKPSNTITRYLYLLSGIVLLFDISMRGGVDNLQGSSSRNTISVLMILLLTVHMIACYNEKKSVGIIYPIFYILVTFKAIGRSGVITSLVILLLFTLLSFENGNSRIRSVKLFIGAIFIILLSYILVSNFFPQVINDVIFNFQWRGLNGLRIYIWTDYINIVKSNPLYFLFGARIGGTQLLDYYSENMHNSFLMLHAKTGIVGFLLVVFALIRMIAKSAKGKNYYILSIFIAVFFRMNFDYTNFNGVLDIVMIYFIAYPYIRGSHEQDILESGRPEA